MPPPKIAMAQLVKAKKAENIPVLSGRLVQLESLLQGTSRGTDDQNGGVDQSPQQKE